jgi:hypothetical protein
MPPIEGCPSREPWEAYMWAIDYWEIASDLAGILLIAIMIWTVDLPFGHH